MLSKISIKRPVTTVMIILMVFLGGLVAREYLEIAFMPSIDYPVIAVSTSYEGAGPEEVEEMVTKPLEKTLSTVSGVRNIRSYSSLGYSQITLEFKDGVDLDKKTNDVRDKLEMAYLPDDAGKPSIYKYDIQQETSSMTVGIRSANYNAYTLYNLVNDRIKNRFESIEGISAVEIWGGRQYEINVTVDPVVLSGYGITIDDISNAISRENANAGAGSVTQGNSSMQLRALGQYKSEEDIKNVPIVTKQGNIIHVSDVADVKKVEKEQNIKSIINGEEGIVLSISKQSDANIVTVSDNIQKEINALQAEFSDLNIELLNSTSDYIKSAIGGVTSTAFESAIVAVFILLLFLRDYKSSLIIGVSIPTSIMATYGLMYLTGITMNIISMGGIVIGIGMLVDNSVVVLENINTYYKRGYTPEDAAYYGTKEVSMAVTASTLTSVAVFGPIAFVPGMVGAIVKDLSLTICFALTASLVVSLTFVPMACSKLLSRQEKRRRLKKRFIFAFLGDICLKFLNGLDVVYRKVLSLALRHRIKTTVLVIVVFIASLCTYPFLTSGLMGETDEGTCSVYIYMPEGTKFEKTQEMLYRALDLIGDIPEVQSSVAMANGTYVSINYQFCDKKERTRSTGQIADEIKLKLSDIAGVSLNVYASGMAMGSMGSGSDLYLTVKGNDNETLRQAGKEIVQLLSTIPGAENVKSSLDDAVAEGNIIINREKAAKYGVTTSSVANAVSAAVSGVTATTIKADGTETDVKIKYDGDSAKYLNDVKSITIPTQDGRLIPITEVAEFAIGDSATTISRENLQRYITITGRFNNLEMSQVQEAVQEKLDNYIMPQGCSYSFGGNLETMNEMMKALTIVLIVSVLLVYMIMASQFESLLYPFIIMFSMPIAITGGMLGLFVTRQSITAMSMLGFIMLIGMVVNNAIVLVDYTNQLRRNNNLGCNEALLEAGPARLRPILMTTLTTIIGIMPMVFSQDSGMETQRPLAIVVIFGLTLSTVITLVFIPVLYSGVTGVRNRVVRFIRNFEDKHFEYVTQSSEGQKTE